MRVYTVLETLLYHHRRWTAACIDGNILVSIIKWLGPGGGVRRSRLKINDRV